MAHYFVKFTFNIVIMKHIKCQYKRCKRQRSVELPFPHARFPQEDTNVFDLQDIAVVDEFHSTIGWYRLHVHCSSAR